MNGKSIYIPFQTISGMRREHFLHNDTETQGENLQAEREPVIRSGTTTGLATWSTRTGAILAGAMEIIEREAYMIMWLNQFSLPRIRLDEISAKNSSLGELLKKCEKYRIKIHAIRMLTDAPTHAVCVVAEDMSGLEPRFALGLKADRSLSRAIEKAAIEALRMRPKYRFFLASGKTWDIQTPVIDIGHEERAYYWAQKENSKQLEFLISGEILPPPKDSWDNDSDEEHLSRIIGWCRSSNFDFASVSLGKSAKNVTPWHIEMAVMPDLQPMHLLERSRMFGSSRWRTVPEKLGLTPLSEPYAAAPHPFV
jgi:ribosomal protein S12 methylthiotransferase accessory factor